MNLINIQAKEWYDAIQVRCSRRKFLNKSIKSEDMNYLSDFIDELNRFEGARVVIGTGNCKKIFKGIIGSYGRIKGASAYVAFIGDTREENMQEKVGYLGEAFILEATNRGLATCWVGGFFDSAEVTNQIEIADYEKILAISPIGYVKEDYSLGEKIMSKMVSSHQRKNLDKLCKSGFQKQWSKWIKSALKCACLAPSVVNRQPWLFTVEDNAIEVAVNESVKNYNISKRLDCGIAMLHIEVGALYEGVKGEWGYLKSPKVARFKVK